MASITDRGEVVPETDLSGEGGRGAAVLLSGFAYSHRQVGEGRRQIIAVHIPGEICAIQGAFTPIDHGICTLTACEIGWLPHATITSWMGQHALLAARLWRSTLIDSSIRGEWLANVGRRTSEQRVAHLLCEMVVRLNAIGLVTKGSCVLPLTQLHIADALGLTSVHVSRVLDKLRRDGRVERKRQSLVVLDWAGLRASGDFDAGYLHLPAAAASFA